MTNTRTNTFYLDSEYDLSKVVDYIEDNTSGTIIDEGAHYGDTWVTVKDVTETEIDKIWDYIDTL